jgi:hypothetical protein
MAVIFGNIMWTMSNNLVEYFIFLVMEREHSYLVYIIIFHFVFDVNHHLCHYAHLVAGGRVPECHITLLTRVVHP